MDSEIQERTIGSSSFHFSIDPASENADEYFKTIEDKLNRKIALGLKKAVAMIVSRMEKMIEERVNFVVNDELDVRLADKLAGSKKGNRIPSVKKPEEKLSAFKK